MHLASLATTPPAGLRHRSSSNRRVFLRVNGGGKQWKKDAVGGDCNLPSFRSRTLLTSGSFLGCRLPLQINTSYFCTLCSHSCASGKNFPVGHPSPNFSEPSTLNLGVLWRSVSGKEVATCLYEYPINPIKPRAGVSHFVRQQNGPKCTQRV